MKYWVVNLVFGAIMNRLRYLLVQFLRRRTRQSRFRTAWTLNGPYTVRTTNPDHREIGKVDDKCGKVLGTYLAHRRDEYMLFRTQPSTGFVYPAQSCAEVFVVAIAHAEPS